MRFLIDECLHESLVGLTKDGFPEMELASIILLL